MNRDANALGDLFLLAALVAAIVVMRSCDARAQEPHRTLTLALSAEEGRELSDGHAAMLWTFRTRAKATGVTEAADAARYCSALRGFPQCPWGVFLLTCDDDRLREVSADVSALVDRWLAGEPIPNPCDGVPWHFGGRRAAAQRPRWHVLRCGNARSTFFSRPGRR